MRESVKVAVQGEIITPFLTGYETTDNDVIKLFTMITASMAPELEESECEELVQVGYDTLSKLLGQGPTEGDQVENEFRLHPSNMHRYQECLETHFGPITNFNIHLARGRVTRSDLEQLGVQFEPALTEEQEARAQAIDEVMGLHAELRDHVLDALETDTHISRVELYAHGNGHTVGTISIMGT
jgi:hypothetical protein